MDSKTPFSPRRGGNDEHAGGHGSRPRGQDRTAFPPRRGAPPRSSFGGRDAGRELADIQHMDEELLRLIMRRARLLAKLRTGNRLDGGVEKALRTSWEEKAARLTRDSRMARELFRLLQSVEPLTRAEEEQAFFNLAPARLPVSLTMPAPTDTVAARCWLALAAASGQTMAVPDVPLTDGVVDGIKALNQLGGQLWWEENGTILSRGGKGLTRDLDKVIHVGDDEFNLWLVLALCLDMPARLKVTGGHDLRFLDLAPLRHFLPQMGARLTNVIPAQNGLPIRLECSGMTPDSITLPEDMPAGFCAALLLAAPFRKNATTCLVPEQALPYVRRIMGLLRQAGIRAELDGRQAAVWPGPLALPAEGSAPHIPMDVPLATSFLALPVLNGGTVRLKGVWPQTDPSAEPSAEPSVAARPDAEAALGLLRALGLAVTVEAGEIGTLAPEGMTAWTALAGAQAGNSAAVSDRPRAHGPIWTEACQTACERAAAFPSLYPLVTALAASAALCGDPVAPGPKLPPIPRLNADGAAQPTGLDENIITGFLACLGLNLTEDRALTRKTDPNSPATTEGADAHGAWLSPSPLWAVAFALAAFARPNLRLANPGVVTARYPAFWALYNGLPSPDLTRKKAMEDAGGKPARRRIIAQGVYGDLPPEAPAGDED